MNEELNKNNSSVKVLTILVIILLVAVLCLGGYLVYDNTKDNDDNTGDNTTNNITENQQENKEPEDQEENNNIETIESLKNYDINAIKNIVLNIPVLNSIDPEMKSVTIENKDEIRGILLNVDNKEEVGVMPSVGFISNVTITINYEGDPSTEIIILDNGNVAINPSVGVGETGYAEYKIENKNLAFELTNKYQN